MLPNRVPRYSATRSEFRASDLQDSGLVPKSRSKDEPKYGTWIPEFSITPSFTLPWIYEREHSVRPRGTGCFIEFADVVLKVGQNLLASTRTAGAIDISSGGLMQGPGKGKPSRLDRALDHFDSLSK
jgi:hypothetical protein